MAAQKDLSAFSSVTRAALQVKDCLVELGYQPDLLECEKLSRFIHLTMSTRNRAFHDMDHAFEVAEGCSPIGQLAALFHDVVYIQVDRSRLMELRSLFSVFDPGEELRLTLPNYSVIERDPWRKAMLAVFGFQPGQTLTPYTGLNEFLSAWVCCEKLRTILKEWDLLRVLACIEATIPFRGVDEKGTTPSAKLLTQLKEAAKVFDLDPSEKELTETIHFAIEVANSDVRGFAAKDPAEFVFNSWALLYENNPSLQSTYYLTSQYREALQKLEGFYSQLAVEKIFRKYEDFPTTKEVSQLQKNAAYNLSVGHEYVKCKLLDTAVLEAIAQLTGGDAPLEIFSGFSKGSKTNTNHRLEDFLEKDGLKPIRKKKNEDVYRLFSEVSHSAARYSLRNPLFSNFFYDYLSEEDFDRVFESVKEFMKGQLAARALLTSFPRNVFLVAAKACSKIALTRKEEIEVLIKSFSDQEAA